MVTAAGSRALAIACVVIASASGAFYLIVPWKPTVEWDIIGAFWVIANFPKLLAFVAFWMSLFGVVRFGVAAMLSD